MTQKRFQYWGRKDGEVQKLWTDWFEWKSDIKEPIQQKGFKGNHLLNEYREIEDDTSE
jgi:hypothetical protein